MKAGWKTVKLNDVCDIVKGRKPNLRATPNKGDLPYLVARYIRGLEDPEYGSATEKGVVTLTEADTVIICDGSNSGEIFTGLNGIMSSTMGKVVKKTEIYDPYLRHFLSSTFELFNGTKTGSAIPHLDKDAFRKLEIPLPPLAEQKRIVALLDEAFAGIDEAKAKTEEILERTQALFESHLQSIFTQRGLDWVERRLGELSRINYGYTESASSEKIGPHFLRITDIQDDGVDWNTVPYCPIDKADFPKYKLTDGDIVFARTGATTGKSYLVSNPPDSVFASYLIRVQLSDKALIPGFLYLFFQTRSYWDVIRAGVSGSAQGGFNASKLGELTIPYPASLNEQKAVIHSIREIQADTLKAGKLSNRKLQALGELRESLLTQAFAGELTA